MDQGLAALIGATPTANSPPCTARRPVAWEEAVRGNTALVTQRDEGRHDGSAPGPVASSSASMPSAVADMFLDPDVHGGERVPDIGTGTGHTAALVAARRCAVTTVEVDDTSPTKRKNLARAGYQP